MWLHTSWVWEVHIIGFYVYLDRKCSWKLVLFKMTEIFVSINFNYPLFQFTNNPFQTRRTLHQKFPKKRTRDMVQGFKFLRPSLLETKTIFDFRWTSECCDVRKECCKVGRCRKENGSPYTWNGYGCRDRRRSFWEFVPDRYL